MDGIPLFGQKSCIQDKFRIYWASKSMPAAKPQIFVDISGALKPTRWAKFWEFVLFFHLKRQGYTDIPEQKSSCGHIIFIHKSYNEIVGKIVSLAQKQGGQKWHFSLGSTITLLLQKDSSSFQAS